MNHISPGAPCASGACLDELERFDDSAYVTGRSTAWERAKRQQTPAQELAGLLPEINAARKLVAHYARTARWFRNHPAVASIPDAEHGLLKRHEARQGYVIWRMRHSRQCKRIGALRRLLAPASPSFLMAAE